MNLYKKCLLIALIASFIFAMPVKSLKSQSSDDPEELIQKGLEKLKELKSAEAEKLFNKALKQDARHALARKGLRTLREQQEQQKKGLFKRMFK